MVMNVIFHLAAGHTSPSTAGINLIMIGAELAMMVAPGAGVLGLEAMLHRKFEGTALVDGPQLLFFQALHARRTIRLKLGESMLTLATEVVSHKTIYVSLRYASDRELRALAGKGNLERTDATGLLVASGIFIVLGIYGLAFSALYDLTLVPLIALSLASIAAGLGALFGRRFALWLALLLFPLGIVEAVATLFYSVTVSGWYPSEVVAAFNASLILYMLGLTVSLLLVIDRRGQLK